MSRLDKAPRGLPGLLGLAPPLLAPTDEVNARGPVPAELAAPAAPAVPATPATPAKRKQGGYYIHDADLARAQAAWKHTELLPGGYPTWSEFQVAALLRLAEELEAEHNGGEPFPLLPGRGVR